MLIIMSIIFLKDISPGIIIKGNEELEIQTEKYYVQAFDQSTGKPQLFAGTCTSEYRLKRSRDFKRRKPDNGTYLNKLIYRTNIIFYSSQLKR
jgi:hypothetical protein